MRLADAQSTVRVAMAELAAEICLGGINEIREETKALTDGQAQMLLRNAFMAYATNVEAAQRLLAVDDKLFRDREEGRA